MSEIRVKVDIKEFERGMNDAQKAYNVGVGLGMSRFMEQLSGEIRSTTLGPNVWRSGSIGFGQFASSAQRMAWAMAVNIAKREGHSDFRHGQRTGLIGRKGKVSVGRGSGWARVLELQPHMATHRPPKPQVLWIQSGQGTKTLDWGVEAKEVGTTSGLEGGVNLGAKGYLTTPHEYMAEHEAGKYPFAGFVGQAWVENGTAAAVIDQAVTEQAQKAGLI